MIIYIGALFFVVDGIFYDSEVFAAVLCMCDLSVRRITFGTLGGTAQEGRKGASAFEPRLVPEVSMLPRKV
jgi:hypothetical protein